MDQSTLFVAAAVSVALSGILLWIASTPGRRLDPLAVWGLGRGIGAAGLLLLASNDPLLSRHAANAVLLGAAGLSWAGARGFAGLPARPVLSGAGAAVWLIVSAITLPAGAEGLRLALGCGIGAAYMSGIAVAISRVERLRARGPILVLLTVHAGLYVARSALAATGLDVGHEVTLRTILLLETQVHPLATAFLLVAMRHERARRQGARALAEARNAAEARSRFLAHLSHEVRTPLNGVLGLAQHLSRASNLLPSQQRQVETLEAAGRHLLAIVNDALDIARIDAGQVELVYRPFNPATAAEGCLALVRTAANDKRLTLEFEMDPSTPAMVAGDSTRLQQILLNLLWNALKFTPTGGRIILRVAGTGGVRFEVSDTGPGIPEHALGRLFQDFSPLDPTYGGSGLGLAISARLATRMGGALAYHPGPAGSGAVFSLDLPWFPVSAPARSEGTGGEAASLKQAPNTAAGLNLLVVDDVAANRFVLTAMLNAEGHQATQAANCAAALVHLRKARFDAVLLDLRMPGIDGLETARRIRSLSNADAASTPVIAVSGDDSPATVRACEDAGMVGLITKPIERDLLMAELQRLKTSASRLIPSG